LSRIALAAALGVVGTVAGCGRSTTPVATPTKASPPASRQAAAAAGDTPSTSAKMICGSEAAGEISARLGVQLSQPPAPTWSDHLYSCRYGYPSGVLVLSVKELTDAAATADYYAAMQHSVADQVAVTGLGDAAFAGPDGSTFVRKDFKVLRVDVAGLPAQFGQPPRSRADVASTAATIVMNCWTGA
jgi:hypothetical protein